MPAAITDKNTGKRLFDITTMIDYLKYKIYVFYSFIKGYKLMFLYV